MTDKVPNNYDPRPPRDRKVAGGDSSKPGRRIRNSSERPIVGSGGIMRRITGRSEMDRAKLKRYEPYNYESNSRQVPWVIVALAAWVAVALLIAWQDRSSVSYLVELRDQGMVSVPPTLQRTDRYIQEIAEFAKREGTGLAWQDRSAVRYPRELIGSGFADNPESINSSSRRDLDELFSFAEREGVECTVELDFVSLAPGCTLLVGIQDKYTSLKDTAAMLFVLLIAVLFVNMFAFGAFTHRASRNLLAMNNKGQSFTPEKAVLWFFIPILNMVKPWQVFRELFRGSDPDVITQDETAWKSKGKVPVVVHVWAAIFVVVFLFNPRTIEWFWNSIRLTIDDVIVAHQRLIIADLLMAILGVVAMFVALELHKRQEALHAKVGDLTVTPPPPVNPLEEALKEGIRRKDLDNRKARSKQDESSK